jgi:hypothetical protein
LPEQASVFLDATPFAAAILPQSKPIGGVDPADVLFVEIVDFASTDVPFLTIRVRFVLLDEAGGLSDTGSTVGDVGRWRETTGVRQI